MKKIILTLVIIFTINSIKAQTKWYTKNGIIQFNATTATSPDKIEAINKNAVALLESDSEILQFSVLMNGFVFEKALMQEHFNENYIESVKYPKATFKGTVENFKKINLKVNGTHQAKVKGILTLHGESKEVETTGTITVTNNILHCSANFYIVLADYKINIPKLVADKVATKAMIFVNCKLEPFNK